MTSEINLFVSYFPAGSNSNAIFAKTMRTIQIAEAVILLVILALLFASKLSRFRQMAV